MIDNNFYVTGEWLNDPYLVTNLGGAQRDHSIAFNPDRNEYLVAYLNWDRDPPVPCIGAWRLDSTGARIGVGPRIVPDEGVAVAW